MAKNGLNIARKIKKGESEFLEFKESFSRECLETLSAFANCKGGTLLLGINDKGGVIGISGNQKQLKDIANQIVQGTALQPSS